MDNPLKFAISNNSLHGIEKTYDPLYPIDLC